MNHLKSIEPGTWCGVPGCPCGGKPRESASVHDPVADTARALAHLHATAGAKVTGLGARADRIRMLTRRSAIEDAARACGSQVYAAFCALVTGDAGRAPEVKRG